MIYLTGQLLLFLLVTGFVGFVMGWLLRGAMLSFSTLDSSKVLYRAAESQADLFGSLSSEQSAIGKDKR